MSRNIKLRGRERWMISPPLGWDIKRHKEALGGSEEDTIRYGDDKRFTVDEKMVGDVKMMMATRMR